MPELLWKAYIDFEVDEGERERARALYERLIEASGHVKVWIAYATFEAESIPIPRADRDDEDEDAETPMVDGDIERARVVFGRAYKDLKSKGVKSEVSFPDMGSKRELIGFKRVALLEVWKTFEEQHGTDEDASKVQAMMPIVSKRRHVDEETGQVVEGTFAVLPAAFSDVLGQTGRWSSRTTSVSQTRPASSSSRWRTRGSPSKLPTVAGPGCSPVLRKQRRVRRRIRMSQWPLVTMRLVAQTKSDRAFHSG
jgi:hypothetical protein